MGGWGGSWCEQDDQGGLEMGAGLGRGLTLFVHDAIRLILELMGEGRARLELAGAGWAGGAGILGLVGRGAGWAGWGWVGLTLN